VPETLNDREQDNWAVLLAIADTIGGGWDKLARAAAVGLSSAGGAGDPTIGTLLLRDLRDLFEATPSWTLADGKSVKRLTSTFIVEKLGSMEERPWSEYGRARKPISQRQLAVVLAPFGVQPGSVGLADGKTAKGYDLKDLEEVFSRYAPDSADSIRKSVKSLCAVGENDDFASVKSEGFDGSKNGNSSHGDKDFDVLTDRNDQISRAAAENNGNFGRGKEKHTSDEAMSDVRERAHAAAGDAGYGGGDGDDNGDEEVLA
jgi:hypothetical protein